MGPIQRAVAENVPFRIDIGEDQPNEVRSNRDPSALLILFRVRTSDSIPSFGKEGTKTALFGIRI